MAQVAVLASAGEDLPLVAPVRYTLATVAARTLAVDTEPELVAVAHKPVVDIQLGVQHTQAVDTAVPAQHTLVADTAVALRTPVADTAEHNKVGNIHSYSLHMLHPDQSREKVRPDHDNQHKSGCCNTAAVWADNIDNSADTAWAVVDNTTWAVAAGCNAVVVHIQY